MPQTGEQRIVVRLSAEAGDFYFLQNVQSDSRNHPVSDLEDTGEHFP
jgi:hypothetical protein